MALPLPDVESLASRFVICAQSVGAFMSLLTLATPPQLAEEEMPARAASRLIHDHLLLDGTPALNLASFVTTYMEEEAEKLMMDQYAMQAVNPYDSILMDVLRV